ncbi:sestrin-2-like isoform X2 [Amphibalanus amphitrite]|uniref:sestrin-2-like isoform X2 n=1 Tax=Amphibalanus amphitrite TaxID=1232801 RepID=UPI001C9294D8|nr:sestrin-2-like isoform X2 [Amphibalanus amphitrite]XP_043213486.1 sestrin-2-like isoform X2 [Amphibalanus amphitrite]XP_043213495.1 sestrin-2-like isoform X2 [Amphibalanus amphitrite]
MGSLVNTSVTSLTPLPPPPPATEPGAGADPAQRSMAAHPEYLAVFSRAHHFLMRGDGPLAFDMRHYVAIMAVGRHQCHVLLDQLKEEFVASGGEQRWLDGLQHVPKKLSDLSEVNKLLAHRPWLLNRSHIERLARGRDNWSLGELLQALTVLAHYHALCSFVLGCRALDADGAADSETEGPARSSPGAAEPSECASGPPSDGAPVRQLMQKMRSLSEQRQSAGQLTPEQKNVIYEAVDSGGVVADRPAPRPPRHDIDRFVEDADFAYEDFSRRGEGSSVPTFRVQDYSWEDHGFSLVNRLYSDVGVLLDDKFRTAYQLTYQTMGSFRAVDTGLFRRAVWRYIQCLYGIRHDDYDYAVVNQLLDRRLKAFVKTMCVYPERLDGAGGGLRPLSDGMQGFQHSEKVHVAILCLEARLQSELLYALRAVMRYTT